MRPDPAVQRLGTVLLLVTCGCDQRRTVAPETHPEARPTTIHAPAVAKNEPLPPAPRPEPQAAIVAAVSQSVGANATLEQQLWFRGKDGELVGYVLHASDSYEVCQSQASDPATCDQPTWQDAPLKGCFDYGLMIVKLAPDGTAQVDTKSQLPRGACDLAVSRFEAVDVDHDGATEIVLFYHWSVDWFGPMGQEGEPDPDDGSSEQGGDALAVLRPDLSVQFVYDVEWLPIADWAAAFSQNYHYGSHAFRNVDSDRHPDIVVERTHYDATYDTCPEDKDGWPTESPNEDDECPSREQHTLLYDAEADTWPLPAKLSTWY